MLWNDEQIHDRERFEIVVHQQEVWIIACSQTLAFGLEFTVQNLRAKFSSLALQLKLFAARGAKEIRERTVVRERGNPLVAAVRAISPRSHPCLRPRPGVLRSAGVGRLGFLEAEFHQA